MTDAKKEGLIITMDDIMRAGHCAMGARSWFRRHGLDFNGFMQHGIAASEFLEKGDCLAEQVVDATLKRRD